MAACRRAHNTDILGHETALSFEGPPSPALPPTATDANSAAPPSHSPKLPQNPLHRKQHRLPDVAPGRPAHAGPKPTRNVMRCQDPF